MELLIALPFPEIASIANKFNFFSLISIKNNWIWQDSNPRPLCLFQIVFSSLISNISRISERPQMWSSFPPCGIFWYYPYPTRHPLIHVTWQFSQIHSFFQRLFVLKCNSKNVTWHFGSSFPLCIIRWHFRDYLPLECHVVSELL